MPITVDGHDLRISDVLRVARAGADVQLSDAARKATAASEAAVLRLVESGAPIYGVTTGIGDFARIRISPEQGGELQHRIVRSHSAAVGDPLSGEDVRAVMLARINTLAKGYSGIRLTTLDAYIAMLNAGIVPVVPEQGSLGVSGDLAQLAHIALALTGEGEAFHHDARMPAHDALVAAGLAPVRLTYKEGLALINGTQFMSGVSSLFLADTESLYLHSLLAVALTLEALGAVRQPFDPRVSELKPQNGHAEVSMILRRLWQGGSICTAASQKVQDGYSIRCSPQILAPSFATLGHVRGVVERELNSASDNPLVFSETDEVLAAGNFHGQSIAMSMDFLAIATAEVASLAERLTNRLLNPALSGLPAFLAVGEGLNSGLMIAQYTQAALLSECRLLAHPAVLDNVSVSADQEDHVCMGSVVIRKYRQLLRCARSVCAIHLLCAAQAVDLRSRSDSSFKLGAGTSAAYSLLRRHVPFMEDDRPLAPDIFALETLIRTDSLADAAGLGAAGGAV